MEESNERSLLLSPSPLLSSSHGSNGISSDSNAHDKDKILKDCVKSIYYIFFLISFTMIAASIMYLVSLYNPSFPLSTMFILLLLSHIAYIIMIAVITHKALQSIMLNSHENKTLGIQNFSAKWHRLNEGRIPLIQYLIQNIGWISSIHALVLVSEILLFLETMPTASQIPAYSILVPIYIMSYIVLSNAVICKSTSMHTTFSWVLILKTTILVNIRMYRHNLFTYYEAMVGIFVLIGYWLLLMSQIFVNYVFETCILKNYQVIACICYIVSFTCFFAACYTYCAYLEGDATGYLKVTMYLVITGVVTLSYGFSGVVSAYIDTAITQKGGETPVRLVKVSTGGWDRDVNASLYDNTLIGNVIMKANMCTLPSSFCNKISCSSCCNSTVEMFIRPSSSISNNSSHTNYV